MNAFDDLISWCERRLIRFPRLLLILSVLFCGITFYYTYNHLGINTSTADMLSPDLPFQQNQRRIDKAFPEDAASMLFVVEGITPEETSIAANQIVKLLSDKTEQFDSIYIPNENAFLQKQGLLYLEQSELENVAKKLTDAQPFIGFLSQDFSLNGLFSLIGTALNNHEQAAIDLKPLLNAVSNTLDNQLNGKAQALSWQLLLADNKLNADANRLLVIAKPKLNFNEMLPAELAQNAARLAGRTVMNDNANVRVRITGETALEHEELESVSQSAEWAGIASLILVFLVQWVGLRSLNLLIATYMVLIMGLIFTAGFAAITVGHLNIISIAFASLYIGLGVDYAVHLCLYYRESKSQGHTNAEAVNHCLQGVGSSLFLCALTTAIGFFAFIPTDYSGVSELGIISGGGIFIGLFISIIIMPAWFCVFPVNNPKPIRSKFAPTFIITFPFKYAKAIKTVSILLAITSCFILTQLTFDANPINLRDPKSESVSTIEELLKAKNDSPFAVTGLSRSLDEAKQTADKMSKLSSVNSAITLASFVAENQEDKLTILDDLNLMLGNSLKSFPVELKDNGKQEQAVLDLQLAISKAIAEKSQNASLADLLKLQQQLNSLMTKANKTDYQQLEKHLLSLLPYTMQRLKNSLSATEFGLDDIPADLKKHWLSSDGYYRVLITPAKDQNDVHNLREFVAQVQGVDNSVSGLPIANEAGGTAVVNAFLQAFGGAFFAISLLLWWTYHNFKQMALVIGPLLLAALLTGASNVVLSNPFNFANIIALPLLLGLGIDSSILIMHKLHFNKHHDDNLLQSSTTRGIIFSSLTTLFSFSSLVFTSHRGMASMGLLLTIGLFFTVICSLVVLPAFSGKKL